ncbi:hypothetical protein GLE_2671 [Lysobacter enzymogenes]|uniref:Uncharacterized protein n=1 Tax=Lysobacter enzymogenes TaxID=69 RepID=A0A0S2DHU3_LYSEN|nr:hypothetical protein GLE_2671 [Lysobacter enzymogenes]
MPECLHGASLTRGPGGAHSVEGERGRAFRPDAFRSGAVWGERQERKASGLKPLPQQLCIAWARTGFCGRAFRPDAFRSGAVWGRAIRAKVIGAEAPPTTAACKRKRSGRSSCFRTLRTRCLPNRSTRRRGLGRKSCPSRQIAESACTSSEIRQRHEVRRRPTVPLCT